MDIISFTDFQVVLFSPTFTDTINVIVTTCEAALVLLMVTYPDQGHAKRSCSGRTRV